MVSEQAFIKFKELYSKKYNTQLSDEEATMMATDLLNLMRILVRPISKSCNIESYS